MHPEEKKRKYMPSSLRMIEGASTSGPSLSIRSMIVIGEPSGVVPSACIFISLIGVFTSGGTVLPQTPTNVLVHGVVQ